MGTALTTQKTLTCNLLMTMGQFRAINIGSRKPSCTKTVVPKMAVSSDRMRRRQRSFQKIPSNPKNPNHNRNSMFLSKIGCIVHQKLGCQLRFSSKWADFCTCSNIGLKQQKHFFRSIAIQHHHNQSFMKPPSGHHCSGVFSMTSAEFMTPWRRNTITNQSEVPGSKQCRGTGLSHACPC